MSISPSNQGQTEWIESDKIPAKFPTAKVKKFSAGDFIQHSLFYVCLPDQSSEHVDDVRCPTLGRALDGLAHAGLEIISSPSLELRAVFAIAFTDQLRQKALFIPLDKNPDVTGLKIDLLRATQEFLDYVQNPARGPKADATFESISKVLLALRAGKDSIE